MPWPKPPLTTCFEQTEWLISIESCGKPFGSGSRVKQGVSEGRGGQRAATDGERKRAPRGERSGQILEIIRTNPGIDTSGICEKLGVTDDKGVASIRAAIFQLSKKGLEKEGKGRYIIAEGAAQEMSASE